MQSMTINGHPITYVEYGKAGNDTLILLPGWAQDHRLFKNLAPLLAADFHVICLNYRGHDGDQTLLSDFTEADLVDDTADFVGRKQLGSFHLVSTSHGCWVNIDLCERFGRTKLDRTVVIDWLMQPHPGFYKQLDDGQHPERYQAGRQSFFDEWIASTDNADVINHIQAEMPWFSGEMWMRACREIERGYRKWGSPLDRMRALADKPAVLHIYSQPLSEDYRRFQSAFAAENPWFEPYHIPGQTHFPTLESPGPVAAAITGFIKRRNEQPRHGAAS